MNKVLLIGRLTKDPETKNVGNDNKVCRFGLAVNRRFKKDENNNADFFNVVAWNKTAELCQQYIQKGSQVAISGRIEIDSWKNDDGRQFITNIVVEEIEFLGKSNKQKEENDIAKNNDPFDDDLF